MEDHDVALWIRGHDLIIKANNENAQGELEKLAFVKKDKNVYRSLPLNFSRIISIFPDHKLYFQEDNIWSASLKTSLKIKPRDYQEESHKKWMDVKRGVIVLPTGTGKTIQALMAINDLNCSTLIIVPTIDLLHQWKSSLIANLDVSEEGIGIIGGGLKQLKPITITTYDSANIHIRRLQLFKLVIFDEVHHLPTETYRNIAVGIIAPYRMGLSATPERIDELHKDLPFLVGDVISRKTHKELKEHIADFRLERIDIDLSEDETERYKENMKIYRNYIVRKRMFFFGKNAYQQLIYRVGRDKEARKALLAHQEARKIALNAGKKLEMVSKLLNAHQDDKIILFSEFNSIVDAISQTFLIPAITYRTPKKERKEILDGFKTGSLTKVVTGRVLDEGVDVPDASVGIIVSGSGSERAYIQRLGRIIRPKEKEALLYELITKKTLETRTAYKRKKGVEYES